MLKARLPEQPRALERQAVISQSLRELTDMAN